MFVVEGDRERFAADLDAMPGVPDYDLTPLDDGRFYAYLRPETNPFISSLIGTLTHDSHIITLLIASRDGSARVTVIGTSADHQAAVDDLPSEIERVGEYMEYDGIEAGLSDRQREAVETGLSLGYYGTPRRAIHEDIAACMECGRTLLRNTSRRRKRSSFRP